MAATIRDVAREADVSVASVSRALNGHPSVHPETRARIAAVAARLGYVPHAGARSLSTARAHAIGAVLPDLHGEFFSEMLRGMAREADTRGYQLLLSYMHADIGLAAQAMAAMRGRVDGLVVMAPQLDARALDTILPRATPAVLLNTAIAPDRHVLRVDGRAGAEAMTRHLLAPGRRGVVHVAGPEGNVDAEDRRVGYLAAMAKARAQPLVIPGNFSEEAGTAAVKRLLGEGYAVDAIFAGNDMMALGALTALRDAGVTVPGTVAIGGFDDVPLARYLSLTTMRVPIADMGARGVARLLDELAGRAAPPELELITPELVVRSTCRSV